MKKLFFLIFFYMSCRVFTQTLYWERISPDEFVLDVLYDGNNYLYYSGGNDPFKLYRSSNLGNTWTQVGNGLSGNRLYNLAIDSAGTLWGVSDRAYCIYFSTNQGILWNTSLSTSYPMYSIEVSRNNWIWAGGKNRIAYSSNGGLSWIIDSITTEDIKCIASNSHNHLFVGTTGDGIYRSTNLGVTWEKVFGFNGWSMAWDFVVGDSNKIYSPASNKIRLSTDNGSTWNIISDKELSSLSKNNYNEFLGGGPGVWKSVNNCISWSHLGFSSLDRPSSFAFSDSIIIVGTRHGVYRYEPSIPPYIGNFYFPTNLGNKWQHIYSSSQGKWQKINSIIKDTVINQKKYYRIEGDINDWIRYSNEEKRLYIYWNDSDYIHMDYSLNEGSTIPMMLFNSHAVINANMLSPGYLSIFDSLYHLKKYVYSYVHGPSDWVSYTFADAENIGEVSFEYVSSGIGGLWDIENGELIRAIINSDSATFTFSDRQKPIIAFTPLNITNSYSINFNFVVDHIHTAFGQNRQMNFIDSVLMISYYSNGDSVRSNESVIAVNELNTRNYFLSFTLDSTLVKNGFAFYYKIYSVDKGIIKEFSTKPDTGYYKLIYSDTLSNVSNNDVGYNFSLSQNYPNPFNPSTRIQYRVSSSGFVILKVYDVLGNEVASLVDEYKPVGIYEVEFNASNLASGIYFYKLVAGNISSTKKMILLR